MLSRDNYECFTIWVKFLISNICCCFLQASSVQDKYSTLEIRHIQIDELPRTQVQKTKCVFDTKNAVFENNIDFQKEFYPLHILFFS